ncbi:PREDICTED: zinc finger protein 2-like [Ceratosolen solmsi marchali]|uniref:Zinc finger protein 2-like n=1 Tax=Ceratosolen solmsi marchali TaxID=326594 RepID=A0AAJ7DZH5_9HYME|nr:PREDICTED: zinc finger protein 2-like [Ceratosolen solmsi marchali]
MILSLCRDETFGGLSGMLRQILSPTSENDELNFPGAGGSGGGGGCCNILQQQSPFLFNSHASVLSSSLQMPPSTSLSQHHLISMQEQQQRQQHQVAYHEHVQILTETHLCPNCGVKLTYHIKMNNPHREQVDQMLDVGETQLMRFTCHVCSRTFLAQSHMKPPNEHQSQPPQQQQQQQQHQQQQQQQQQQHQIAHILSRMQTGSSNLVNASNPSQTHYQATSGTGGPIHQTVSTSQDKNFSCERCQASFRYRTLLEKHRKMHETVAGQDKPYSCSRCHMRFETRNLYNHHAKTHKPLVGQPERSGNTNATVSGATIPIGKDSTGSVLYGKTNNASYACETCAKEFPTAESLASHKAVHRSRPLICDVCGKGFTHRKYYVVHQRIHTGERPYLCAMCGKSFTQASTLTVHRRYHTGERPYTCTLCGKGFVTRTIMLNHMKKH